MVALGAGVTNRQSGQPGHIRTTIDQTALLNDVCLLERKENGSFSRCAYLENLRQEHTLAGAGGAICLPRSS